jgi:hypothetical protein
MISGLRCLDHEAAKTVQEIFCVLFLQFVFVVPFFPQYLR